MTETRRWDGPALGTCVNYINRKGHDPDSERSHRRISK